MSSICDLFKLSLNSLSVLLAPFQCNGVLGDLRGDLHALKVMCKTAEYLLMGKVRYLDKYRGLFSH